MKLSESSPNLEFKKLQTRYFIPYFLASFSDWIQGPYVYQVYKDYGYNERDIAILYIVGFMSSMVFGTFVGSLADKLGRKLICTFYGITYSLCCLSKFSSDFYVLVYGRIFGGIATSILFSAFEAWYINEHVNFYAFPIEWLNVTFAGATFGSGLFAIVSGLIAHIVADSFGFGPISPFAVAVPFLIASTVFIHFFWQEHFNHRVSSNNFLSSTMYASLKYLLTDPCLLALGLVQCIYEGIMYTFIFAWTPVLEILSPPLGLVFSCFMMALMVGSRIYSILSLKLLKAESLLNITLYTSTFSIAAVAVLTSSLFDANRFLSTNLCFISFLVYEISVGMYYPATGYLRGRIIPEQQRATITNWLRVPTNCITCFTLIFIKDDDSHGRKLKAIHSVFVCSSFCLILALIGSAAFRKMYIKNKFKNDTSKGLHPLQPLASTSSQYS